MFPGGRLQNLCVVIHCVHVGEEAGGLHDDEWHHAEPEIVSLSDTARHTICDLPLPTQLHQNHIMYMYKYLHLYTQSDFTETLDFLHGIPDSSVKNAKHNNPGESGLWYSCRGGSRNSFRGGGGGGGSGPEFFRRGGLGSRSVGIFIY